MKFEAIIFDLDGTLWDSTDSVLLAWNNSLKKYNINMDKETLSTMFGKTLEDISHEYFGNLGVEKASEIIDSCGKEEIDVLNLYGGKLYPNLESVLDVLSKEYKLMIVSNCQEGYIESFLNYHKFSKYFCDIESNGGTGLVKSENIKLIMKRNNISRAVYVGDTEIDMRAAKEAGIPFIHAKYGFGDFTSEYEIDDISQLKDVIKNMEEN